MPTNRRKLWEELLIQGIALGGLFLSMRMVLKYLDPYKEQREQAKKRSAFLKQVLGRALDLNEFEQLLAANVINPAHIDTSVDDVCGLDGLVQELEMKVLMPMMHPNLYCTTLWKPTRGVLLYGPPGTGKTMLAKALARYSSCYFLNITSSSIMSKWLGDASRLVRAIFTLADKLQPCIIFIDEVDALLGKRGSSSEHEASLQVKTEFMQLWDGMESGRGQRVVVMGATNRPWMVDEAVLRRFSVQHEVGLPDVAQRKAILRSYLRRHQREVGGDAVAEALLQNAAVPGKSPSGALDWLAARTQGFSGSDLMELCAAAAQQVLGEHWAAQAAAERGRRANTGAGGDAAASTSSSSGSGGPLKLRPMVLADFEAVLAHKRPGTEQADEYNRRMGGASSSSGAGGAGGFDGFGSGGAGGDMSIGAVLELVARLARMQAAMQQGDAGEPAPNGNMDGVD